MEKSTSQRVRQNMALTLIVRPLSAMAGLLVLVALSRLLSTHEYGTYFAIWAIVEIIILASNLGLLHAAYRYVSSMEWSDSSIHLQGPFWMLLSCRIVTLLLFCTLLFLVSEFTNFLVGYSISKLTVRLLLVIVLAEGVARYIEVLFDSMLFQGYSQVTLIARTCLRLLGLTFFAFNGLIDLRTVIYIEIGAAGVGATLGIFMLWRLYKNSSDNSVTSASEKVNVSRMTRFAFPAYAVQILGLSYGPDALKLALGNAAGASSIALFGFSYSIAAVAQRYMPINILSGIFRPIFIAAAKKQDAERTLSEVLNLSIKLNWIVILPAFCFFYFAGTPLFFYLSSGKFSNAGVVISWLLFGLLAIAIHLNLSMYCLSKEYVWPPLLATTASTVSLPLGYILAQKFGAIGIAAAFCASETIWSVICVISLKAKSGCNIRLDLASLAKLIGIVLIVLFVHLLIERFLLAPWLPSALTAPATFLVVLFWVGAFSDLEKRWLISVLPVNMRLFSLQAK